MLLNGASVETADYSIFAWQWTGLPAGASIFVQEWTYLHRQRAGLQPLWLASVLDYGSQHGWPAWPMAHPVGKLMEVLCSYLSFISNLCVRLRVIFSRVLSGFWLPSAVCCALPDRWRYWRYNWFLSADWTIQFARSMSQEKMWCMYSSC